MLWRWRLRKRGTFAITTFVFFSVASFVLFSNMVRYPESHELPNDYDLNYDHLLKERNHNGRADGSIHQQSVVRRTVAVPLLIPGPLKHIDRKPQSHKDVYNGNDGDLQYQDVNPKFAPILKENVKIGGKVPAYKESDVDYALPDGGENEEKNIENVVIEEDNNNEDDDEGEETYEELPENPEFKPGDFDQMPKTTKPPISVEEVQTGNGKGESQSVKHDRKPKSSSSKSNLRPSQNKAGDSADNKGAEGGRGNGGIIKSGGINVMGRKGVISGQGKPFIIDAGNRPDRPPQPRKDSSQQLVGNAENGRVGRGPCQGRQNCTDNNDNVLTANHRVQIAGQQGLNAGRQASAPRTSGSTLPAANEKKGVKLQAGAPPPLKNAPQNDNNDNSIFKMNQAPPRQHFVHNAPQPFQMQQIQKPIIHERKDDQNNDNINKNNALNLVSDRKLQEMSASNGEGQKEREKDPSTLYNNGGFRMIVDKIYWAPEVEKYVPKGITEDEVKAFASRVRKQQVDKMTAPQWNKCGRPRNQFIELKDKTALCARYRAPHNKLIIGEVLSFYLGRMLGLDNIPVVVLSEADTSKPQWQGQDFRKAGWDQGNTVAFIQWIMNLDHQGSHVKMPKILLDAYEHGKTVDFQHPDLQTMTLDDLTAVLQWTDMMLFDYVTGHYDRVASMQDGAEREKRPTIMHESIRNLRKTWNNGKLWLIDNESGLFDAYELIYKGGKMGHRFVDFHKQILQISCVYRKELVENLKKLAESPNPMDDLINYANEQEPLLNKVRDIAQHRLFNKHFPDRLKEAYSWIKSCEQR